MEVIIYASIALVVGCVVIYLIMRLRFEKHNAELQQVVSEKDRINNELVQVRQAEMRLEGDVARYREQNAVLEYEKENMTGRMNEYANQMQEMGKRSESLAKELSETAVQYARLQAEYKSLEEQLKSLEEEREEREKLMLSQFKNMASEIMDEKNRAFKEMSRESLKVILDPLNRDIDSFRKQVSQCYDEDNKGRAALTALLNNLSEQNERVQREADKLSSALRGGTKVQGDWGEMILLNILQQSGLQMGRDFEIQKSVDNPGDNKRPDAILHFPNHSDLIIDSKVSFTAYYAYMNAADEQSRAAYAREHLKSVCTHIDQLSKREYAGRNKNSYEFVIMFVPIESMFMLAIDEALAQGRNLWNEAYAKQVIIMTPTNLVLAVRMLQDMWRQESLRSNIEKIKERAEKMYAQFASFASDLENVRQHIKVALSSCDSAVGRLTTGNDNLMSQFDKMQKLGLTPKVAKGAQKNYKILQGQAGIEQDSLPDAAYEPATEIAPEE